MKQIIRTDNAPQPIGPYSQAIITGNGLVFVSGQIPLMPDGTLVEGDIEVQTEQVIQNISQILEACGCTLEDVVKTTVILTNIDDFAAMNRVYGKFFNNSKPARAILQAVKLPKNAGIEIDAIAEKK
jgi:2-iminobutanoate/2-iminopropanoate deaminase